MKSGPTVDPAPADAVTPELAQWWARHVDPAPPISVTRIGAGQSNITALVADADGRQWVLRRPPAGARPGAHDMAREALVLRALAASPVPVPAVVAEGRDEAGLTGPFYVMHRAPGAALVDETDASALAPAQRRALSDETVRVLAALHSVDPVSVGLGGLGPATGYLERQIHRTERNWAAWGADSASDAVWRAGHRILAARVPRGQRTTLAHGDFRLANVLTRGAEITAVLDWELCTVGDPLADLAWLVDDWRDPSDPAIVMPSPTRAGGFRPRAEIIADYAERTGLDVGDLGIYRVFTHWKAATLLQGVLCRRRAGGLGEHGALDLAAVEQTVDHLLHEALVLAGAD